MIKTVTLSGTETAVEGLGGFNTVVHNMSSGAVYASKYPDIVAGADNVAEIPAGAAKLISTTNGTVYLVGSGRVELTGQDYDGVNCSSSAVSGVAAGGSGVTEQFVTEQDALNLEAAKSYTDGVLEETKGSLEQQLSQSSDKISQMDEDISALQSEKADKSELPTSLPANGGNADTVNGHTVKADVPEDAVFTDTTYTNMFGAAASYEGVSGLVPAPSAGGAYRYLSSGGVWTSPFSCTTVSSSDKDMSTWTNSGVFYVSASVNPTGAPVASTNAIVVVMGMSTATVRQIWFSCGGTSGNTVDVFTRTRASGAWGMWYKVGLTVS